MLCELSTSQGTALRNQLIPRSAGGTWVHPVDVFVPSGVALQAVVFAHGGGGTKGQFAAQLNVAYPGTVNWSLLKFWRTIAIFPQGQACTGLKDPTYNPIGADTRSDAHPFGIPSWHNHFMYSQAGYTDAGGVFHQADDLDFFKDIGAYITATWGAGVGRSLYGHSNGGMMAARMWAESPLTYTHYISTSGPLATWYETHPIAPAVRRPILLQGGALDDILRIKDGRAGTGDHFYDPQYLQDPTDLSVADVEYQDFIQSGGSGSGLGSHRSFWTTLQQMVTADGGGTISQGAGVTAADALGNPAGMTTWTYGATNQIVLRRLEGAGHHVPDHEAAVGNRMTSQVFGFIAST
jgi:poly(3-hydroxybutyrate) depolymerase